MLILLLDILEITGGTPASASSRPAPVKPPWEWSRCVAPRQSHPLGQQPAKAGWVVDSLTDRMVFFCWNGWGEWSNSGPRCRPSIFSKWKERFNFFCRPKTSYLKRTGDTTWSSIFSCQVQGSSIRAACDGTCDGTCGNFGATMTSPQRSLTDLGVGASLSMFPNLTKHTFIYKFSYIII